MQPARQSKPGIIILASGNISHRLPFIKAASLNASMIPVGLKPAVSYVFEFYLDEVACFIMVVNKGQGEEVRKQFDAVVRKKRVPVTLTILERETQHVVDSLHLAVQEAKTTGIADWIVTPVTTLPTVMPASQSLLCEAEARMSGGWSYLTQDGDVRRYFSRNQLYKNHAGHAFTGVFRAQLANLEEGFAYGFNDLMQVVQRVDEKSKLALQPCEWLDIGHAVNYYQAKSKIVTSRHFNTIAIDPVRGLVQKRSQNVAKLQDEAHYIVHLPEELKVWFPRQIGALVVDGTWASQTTEYYAYPTLAELAMFWSLDVSQWRQCISSVEALMLSFKRYTISVPPQAHNELYIEKMEARVKDFYQQIEGYWDVNLAQNELMINGRKRLNMDALKSWIAEFAAALYRTGDHCIMHGDLCFNNILYDAYGGTIRLIDPRGRMTRAGDPLMGDAKYDMAKFAHSALYSYDYLVSGLYSLTPKQSGFDYEFYHNHNHAMIADLCDGLIAAMGYRRREIDFIVGLLFVSMASLHAEDKDRQTTAYLHGLNILNTVYESA